MREFKLYEKEAILSISLGQDSAWPIFEVGNAVWIDLKRLPKQGEYALVYLPSAKQNVIAKLCKTIEGLALDLNDRAKLREKKSGHNEFRDACVIGVVYELRKYY